MLLRATGDAHMPITCSSHDPNRAGVVTFDEQLGFDVFLCTYTWEFAACRWMIVEKPLNPDCFVQFIASLKRGRGKEKFLPNLGIRFSSLEQH